MASPMKTLKLHYPMIQFLIMVVIQYLSVLLDVTVQMRQDFIAVTLPDTSLAAPFKYLRFNVFANSKLVSHHFFPTGICCSLQILPRAKLNKYMNK